MGQARAHAADCQGQLPLHDMEVNPRSASTVGPLSWLHPPKTECMGPAASSSYIQTRRPFSCSPELLASMSRRFLTARDLTPAAVLAPPILPLVAPSPFMRTPDASTPPHLAFPWATLAILAPRSDRHHVVLLGWKPCRLQWHQRGDRRRFRYVKNRMEKDRKKHGAVSGKGQKTQLTAIDF